MGSFGDSEFSYPRFLKVPFVFVPSGNPLPLEWMAEHPGFVRFAATFRPRPEAEPPPELDAQVAAAPLETPEPQAGPVRHARDHIWRIVPLAMTEGDPRLARPFPDRLLKIVPPPRPLLPPLPDTRLAWLCRIVPPPGPREPPARSRPYCL